MQWYALTVKPQHEKAVADLLRVKGLESYLPVYRSKRCWSDRVKTLDLPLFSQYVFSRFHLERRLTVLEVASVLSIVGFGGVACPVDEREMEALKAVVGSGLPFSPWPFLHAGQRVEIWGGPLKGVEGILAREGSACRVVINVDLLQRAVAVEVERELVRPCEDRMSRAS
jgi:transcription antitermination factor NusG